jgi:DNA-binding response OmpR family regulator/HAMP domain-containing protein
LQVATQQEPITLVVDRLVATFLVIGLLGVILMGAITYFLVKWINRPLEQMLNSAKRAAEGDLSHEVPVIAHDEVGELAATFNLMIRNLAESRSKLEERGKQLASKVEAQTGELDQAREQVARVSKLASLEKMADGMAHIMAHISDPLVSFAGIEEDSGTTSRILVLDSDEEVLGVCERILESEGLDVKTTESVQEALKELEREFYDVIVADIDMPEMGGQELLKEIKFRQPEILVIMTAPFKSTEEAVETVKMGAYDYIPKPFGPHQILLMVYTALQSREVVAKTRRQHAEQRAETIFQRLPVAIALADEAHRVVYNNRAFIELAGGDGQEVVQGKTFRELFGVDPLESDEETGGSKWLKLENVGRTAKLYNFKLPEENLRVLMLVDITETVIKDQQADVFKTETITKAQQVIHQQMRVAQEIAGLLGETTAETKAVLFELIKLAGNLGASR